MVPALLAQLGPALEGLVAQQAQSAAAGAASDIMSKFSGGGNSGGMMPGPLAMAMPGGQSFAMSMGAAGNAARMPFNLAGGTAATGGQILGGFASAAGNQVEGNVMAEAGERAGLFAKKLGEAVTSIDPRDWADLGIVIVDSISLLEKWGDQLTASADQLKAFDASMAEASAEKRMGAMQRGIQLASMTGDSTLNLTESLEGLKDAMLPMRADITNITNNLLAQVIDLGTDFAGVIKEWYSFAKSAARGILKIVSDIAAGLALITDYLKLTSGAYNAIMNASYAIGQALKDSKPSGGLTPQGDFLRAAVRKRELFDPLNMTAPSTYAARGSLAPAPGAGRTP